MTKKRALFLLVLALWLGFSLRVYHLSYQSLDWDEIFSVTLARLPIQEWFFWIWSEDRAQVPGFFFAMWLWTQIGVVEFVARYLSVIAGTAGIPLLYLLGSRIGGRWVGVAGAFLLALNPFQIWYSQEARVYVLLMAVAVTAGFLFLQILYHPNRGLYILLTLTHILGMYLHYLFALAILAQYLFLVLTRSRYRQILPRWFAAQTMVGIAFLPWAGTVFATGGFSQAGIAWIPPANWYDPILTVFVFLLGSTSGFGIWNWIAAGVMVGVAVYGCIRLQGDSFQQDEVRYLMIWFTLPIIFLFLVSLPLPISNKRSVYVDRYLIAELPPLLILIALGARKMIEYQPRLFAAAVVLATLPVVGSLWNLYSNPAFIRDDWRAVAEYLRVNANARQDVLVMDASMTWTYGYYRRSPLLETPVLDSPKNFADTLEKRSFEAGSRIWLLTNTINADAHRFLPNAEEQRNAALDNSLRNELVSRLAVQTEQLYQGVLITGFITK